MVKNQKKDEFTSFTIKVSNETGNSLKLLSNRISKGDSKLNTRLSMNVLSVLTVLAEDAAMVITRPGSWEGSGMAGVLRSHGYEV